MAAILSRPQCDTYRCAAPKPKSKCCLTPKAIAIIFPFSEEIQGAILTSLDEGPASIAHVTKDVHILLQANHTDTDGRVPAATDQVVTVAIYWNNPH